ncbi:MAG: flavodoxin family protein [Bacteroidota bacterium]
MKILVTYWSQTGNTKRVAEAVFEALPGEKTILPMDQVASADGFDLILIGFPVMQFGPPAIAVEFIRRHATGRKTALFVTHAMPVHSNDPRQQALLEKVLSRCRAAAAASEVAGFFHCQGALSEKTAAGLMESDIPELRRFASMRPLTVGHPGREELEQAGIFGITMAGTL